MSEVLERPTLNSDIAHGRLNRRKQIFDRFARQLQVCGVRADLHLLAPGNRARVADMNPLEIPVIVPKFEDSFASEAREIHVALGPI